MGKFHGAGLAGQAACGNALVESRLIREAISSARQRCGRAGHLYAGRIGRSCRRELPGGPLLVFRAGDEIIVRAPQGAHFMLFSEVLLFQSKRYIWWNFVSSSQERIEQAKEEWRTGRFDIVPGDEEEFIPLPENRPMER